MSECWRSVRTGELILKGHMMEKVPDDLLTYQHLSRLSIVEEMISTLPEDMGALYKLKSLRLDDNCLTSLPASLARLSVLTALHVNNNKLSKIQECVWLMEALQVVLFPAVPPHLLGSTFRLL